MSGYNNYSSLIVNIFFVPDEFDCSQLESFSVIYRLL